MRKKLAALISIFLMSSLGCQTIPSKGVAIYEAGETSVVEGWFADHVEIEIYPSKDVDKYIPFTEEERSKCLSIINGTGKDRSAFQHLNKKRVKVVGKIVQYDELDNGPSDNDTILNKKYYQGYQVQNYCYRKYLLIAEQINPLD